MSPVKSVQFCTMPFNWNKQQQKTKVLDLAFSFLNIPALQQLLVYKVYRQIHCQKYTCHSVMHAHISRNSSQSAFFSFFLRYVQAKALFNEKTAGS